MTEINKEQQSASIPAMTWKCSNCGNTIEEQVPPKECPSCHEVCDFLDVTCYIPDCAPGGSDTRL